LRQQGALGSYPRRQSKIWEDARVNLYVKSVSRGLGLSLAAD
jgi:hypothetical protein